MRNVDVIETLDVRVNQFLANVRRQVAEIAIDELFRFRPGGIAVRIIVRPHAVVLAPPFKTVTGGGVSEESAKDLSLEKFAGILGDRQRIYAAESPVIIIPLLQHEGHPANLIFYADELELGITLQDAVEDQFKEGVD